MAGSKSSVTGEDFYGAYDAQETAAKHAEELHMQTVPSLNITYTEVSLGIGACSTLAHFAMCSHGLFWHTQGSMLTVASLADDRLPPLSGLVLSNSC